VRCCRIRIRVRDEQPLSFRIGESETLSFKITEGGAPARTQSKTAIPSQETQIVRPDEGFLLDQVTVAPIPECYGLITYNGGIITVS
jgi:hypothetical protein